MALIARDAELADVVDRLRRHRLVTIVGPGGIGKTALARAASAIAGPDFSMGALTVDLTRADDPAAVEELVAGQLGTADFASLVNSPSDRPALLVIDNCEHVLDAAADAIDTILSSCRMPTVLATSRSPLDLADEVIVPLAPLEVPVDDVDDPTVASVRMFSARVRDLGGSIGPDDGPTVAAICRRLDGMPLALEIAAARSRTTTMAQLLVDIGAGPSGLSRRRFRGQGAHRSVTHVVDWSLDLLDDDLRTAFGQLGAVAGPFDLAMAEAVVDVGTSARHVLDELVDASLVVADTTGDVPGYRLLHPVRAVALDRLRRSGGEEAAVDRAVGHVVEVALGIVLGSSAGWDDQLTRLLAAYDNMIASLRWTLDHDVRPDRALTLLAVLWGVIHQAHRAEVAEVGERVIARWTDPSRPFWADAAATVATCRNLMGRRDEAIELATAALDHADASPFAPASLRRVVAQTLRLQGDAAGACDWFRAGAEAAEANAVQGLAMELRVDEAVLIAELGDPDGAERRLRELVALAERLDAPVNLSWARCALASVLQQQGDPDALEAMQSAVEYASSIRYPAGVSYGLRLLAAEHLERDDRRAAARALVDLLDALLERGGLGDLRMMLDLAAVLLERDGDARWVDVAATAEQMPFTSTVASSIEPGLFERAIEAGGVVLPVRDVYVLCRTKLSAIADAASGGTSESGDTAEPAAGSSLVLEGDVWRWTFVGDTVAVKASKGMADLSRLLAEPGRELAAMDLMGSTKVGDTVDATFDARARREIESRIRELQAEVEEADAHHDPVRSERATSELDRLVDELTAAVGLGGRSRSTGSDAERARSAVTQRIRTTIARIESMHPKLGAHLGRSIETGTFCAYRPEEPVAWTIER